MCHINAIQCQNGVAVNTAAIGIAQKVQRSRPVPDLHVGQGHNLTWVDLAHLEDSSLVLAVDDGLLRAVADDIKRFVDLYVLTIHSLEHSDGIEFRWIVRRRMVECLIYRRLDGLISHIMIQIEDRPAIRIGLQGIGGCPKMSVYTYAIVIQIRVRAHATAMRSHLAVNPASGLDVLIGLSSCAVRVRGLQSLQSCRIDIISIYGDGGVDAAIFARSQCTDIGADEIGTGIEILIDCGIAQRPGQNLV